MQEALMYVLLHNRVDFVHLILENGVGMQNFLTFERLEQLYNSVRNCFRFSSNHFFKNKLIQDLGPANTLHMITKSEEFTIPMVRRSGVIIVGFTSVIHSDRRRS